MVKYSLEKPRREIEDLVYMGHFISKKGAAQEKSCIIVMFLWLRLIIHLFFPLVYLLTIHWTIGTQKYQFWERFCTGWIDDFKLRDDLEAWMMDIPVH